MANRFQAFSTVASADRKWLSGVVPDMRYGRNRLRQPRPVAVAIRRQITSATSGTALEHHFRFAAATMEYGRNRLNQPRIVRIRLVTPLACNTGRTRESSESVGMDLYTRAVDRSMCHAVTKLYFFNLGLLTVAA